MKFGFMGIVAGLALGGLAATAPDAAAQPGGGRGRGIGPQVSAAARSGVHGQQLAGYVKQLQRANGIGAPVNPGQGRGQGMGQGKGQQPKMPMPAPAPGAKPQLQAPMLQPGKLPNGANPAPGAKPALPGGNQVPMPVPIPQPGKGKGKGPNK